MTRFQNLFFAFAACCFCVPATQAQNLPKLLAKPVSSGLLTFTYLIQERGDILVIDFSKGSIAPIAPHEAHDEYPTLSPDGSKVVFYSDRTGDREIFVADLGTGAATQLTRSPGADEDPDWSADGKKIAFSSARSGRGQNVFTMDVSGENVVPITAGSKRKTVPRFSPDGSQIVFSTDEHWPGWDIILLDVASRKEKELTWGIRTNCRASWSHDGKRLSYSHGSGSDVDLYIMDSDGDHGVQVTSRPGKEYDGAWNKPDSGLFFAGELTRGKGDFQIFYQDLASGKLTQVTEGPGATRYLSFLPR